MQPKILVIGASAGGSDALRRILRRLPADFPAPLLVTLHVGPHYSILPSLLERDSVLPVRHARDGEPIVPGVVLVAPPDRHLMVEDGMVRLSDGPKENFSRPAIDPLFRSAALFYRENAVGVVLTGHLDDGTIGLQAIKAYGGVALVQDPEEADAAGMPKSALQHVEVDDCLTLDALADCLAELATAAPRPVDERNNHHAIEKEGRFDLSGRTDIEELRQIGQPSEFACPECSGSLWEIKGSGYPHFRCHTGHSFTPEGLGQAHDGIIEEALWAAVRALHEKQLLMHRFALTATEAERHAAASKHMATAKELSQHAETLRRMVGAQATRRREVSEEEPQ